MLTIKQAASKVAAQHLQRIAAFEKQSAGVLRPIGQALDTILGATGKGLGKAWWNTFKFSPLGTLGGTALLGSALNELRAKATGDPHWSPEMQGYRNVAAGGFPGRAWEFAKRPIQSLFGSTTFSTPEQWLESATRRGGGTLPGLKWKPIGRDAAGNVVMGYSGEGSLPVDPAVSEALRKLEAAQRASGASPTNTSSLGSAVRPRYSYRAVNPADVF